MRAARWDTSIERGGAWRRVITRRTLAQDIPLADPCTWTAWAVNGDGATPVLTVTGVLSSDMLSMTLDVSANTSATLAPGQYEHKLVLGDALLGEPVVLLRGYVAVIDSVEGR